MIPGRARERLLDIAATQFPSGAAYHQYQPLTKKGNLAVGSGFNDDPLWLIAGTDAYLCETGDFTILDEPVAFDGGTETAPLLEHLRRSFRFTCTHLGPHGLPLIGRADWNDCLNLNCFSTQPGESFQITGPSEGPVAESVFIAGLFVKYGAAWAGLLRHLRLDDEAAEADRAVEAVRRAALTAGWDGEWFRRAYDAYGRPVGSRENAEGQIFIEPQGMPDSNVFTKISDCYYQLTSSEKKVADYIAVQRQKVQYLSISELAGNCGVADATISRFCRQIGYRGYNAFKLAVAKSSVVHQGLPAPIAGEVTPEDSIPDMTALFDAV